MARQLGVTQPSICQIVNGQREPGSRLLNSLASLPGIPPAWLQRGEGCLPEGQSFRNVDRCFLPLFERLSSAFPLRSKRRATLFGINVRATDYADTRIVLHLSQEREWGDARFRGLNPDDFVIFETDRSCWATRPWNLEKCICAFKFPDGKTTKRVELGYVHHVEQLFGNGTPSAHVKRLRSDASPPSQRDEESNRAIEDRAFLKWHGRNPRSILGLDSGHFECQRRPVHPRLRRRELAPISIHDVVGLVVAVFHST